MRVMQVAFHEIVDVAAVRDRFVSATCTVCMLGVVRTTRVARGASRRIRLSFCEDMFVDVALMSAVQMPVVQVIDVTFMFDRGMPTARTMCVGVTLVCLMITHFQYLLVLLCPFRGVISIDLKSHLQWRETEN